MSKVEQKRIDKIKRTIMENPRLVRELMISEEQESLVRFVDFRGDVTARDVARRLAISIQNASTRLKVLCDKGYLWREQLKQSSGGHEYRYKSKVDYYIPREIRSYRCG